MVLRTVRTAFLSLAILVPAAQAQMMGATMDAEWVYPSFGSVLESHSIVVSGGVELPSTLIQNDSKHEIDLGEDWIEFRFNSLSNWVDSSFNGWLFRDSLGMLLPITNYTVDSFSSGVTNIAGIVVGFNDDECWADFGGLAVAGPGEWIRLKVELGGGLGNSFCFGDGTGTACPCGNLSGVGEGCSNSTSVGALLTASGTAVASNNDYVLTGSQLPPGVPSLFFSGSNDLGAGNLFGDGLLCTSSQIRRLEIVFVNAAGSASTSVGIPSLLGATSGTRSVMQLWYRDPQGPCSTGFNTTGAIDHVWQ